MTAETTTSPNSYRPEGWETADAYRHYPRTEHFGEMHLAVWAPTVEASTDEPAAPGLVLVEADSPKSYDNPFLSAAIDDLARLSSKNPAAANLLAILGIAASVERSDDAHSISKHIRLAGVFPDIATLNTRLRWVGEQLHPHDVFPAVLPAQGKYSAATFMEHWENDKVLMSAADASDDESVVYAAHDMLTHAIGWATLTSETRQAMRDKHLRMGQIDLMASVVAVADLLAPGQKDTAMFSMFSADIFSQLRPTKSVQLLDQQVARFEALENLPNTPFPDPRDTLVNLQ